MYCCSVKDLRDSISFLPDLSDDFDGSWPAVFGDDCVLNLDKLTGEDVPLFLSNGQFLYPERTNAFGERLLSIGEYALINC